MKIDKAKNRAYTASLIDQDHIIEGAYKRGIYEFYNGVLVIQAVPESIVPLLQHRANAIAKGQDIDWYNQRITNQGYTIKDYYEDEKYVGSDLCTVQMATNPYKVGSLYHKEWQRGYDTGYFRHLRNVKSAEKKKKDKYGVRKKSNS